MDESNYVAYLALAIKQSFPAVFATDANGHMYFERDTGLPPLRQEIGLIKSLAAAIKQELKLDEQLRFRVRKIQQNPREAHMVIRLCGPTLTPTQMSIVKHMAAEFSQRVCPSSQISLLGSSEPMSEDDCTQAAADSAAIFLRSNSGRPVSHASLLLVEEQVMGDFSGAWRTAPPEQIRTRHPNVVVLCNGRALREHVAHFVTADKGTRLDVGYDEEQFGALLFSLHEDKFAALEIEYEAVYVRSAKNARLTLLSARKVPLPEKFKAGE